jgi:exonuclease VII small subunit
MTSKNMPADIKSKSIKETKEEINKILEKIEKGSTNLESHTNDYDRLLKLNKHIDELFKKRLKEINSLGKKNVEK